MFSILCLSDSDKHFSSAINEYSKRLGKDCSIINLIPAQANTREECVALDTQQISDYLQQQGSRYDTITLVSLHVSSLPTQSRVDTFPVSQRHLFIIGWPFGLDEEKLKMKSIGLGAQTMNHCLAKLVLLEQIYRITMISQDKQYHY